MRRAAAAGRRPRSWLPSPASFATSASRARRPSRTTSGAQLCIEALPGCSSGSSLSVTKGSISTGNATQRIAIYSMVAPRV